MADTINMFNVTAHSSTIGLLASKIARTEAEARGIVKLMERTYGPSKYYRITNTVTLETVYEA